MLIQFLVKTSYVRNYTVLHLVMLRIDEYMGKVMIDETDDTDKNSKYRKYKLGFSCLSIG